MEFNKSLKKLSQSCDLCLAESFEISGRTCRKKKFKLSGSRFCKRIPGILLNQCDDYNKRMFVRRLSFLIVLGVSVYLMVYFNLFGKLIWQSERSKHLQSGPFTGYRDCRPVEKVGFLKTYNFASETIQNNIMRFGLIRDLNFVLPASGFHLSINETFRSSILKKTLWSEAGLEYNVLCLGTRWNHSEVLEVLGKGSLFVSVVSDPIETFISFWNTYKIERKLDISLENYVRLSSKTGGFPDDYKKLGFYQNQMLWKFGLDLGLLNNKAAIKEKILEIENNFDLIVVSERFDESMILLRDELCWDYRDILSLNQISHEKMNLSSEARSTLKSWLWGDYMLYSHFVDRFQEKVSKYDPRRMKKDLGILHHANSNLKSHCSSHYNLFTGVQRQFDEFDIQVCKLMILEEENFTNELRSKQSKKCLKIIQEKNKSNNASQIKKKSILKS